MSEIQNMVDSALDAVMEYAEARQALNTAWDEYEYDAAYHTSNLQDSVEDAKKEATKAIIALIDKRISEVCK